MFPPYIASALEVLEVWTTHVLKEIVLSLCLFATGMYSIYRCCCGYSFIFATSEIYEFNFRIERAADRIYIFVMRTLIQRRAIP
jgi:hypothetical protein